MKKIALACLALSFVSIAAQGRDSLDGCGLGWEVTDKKTFTATTTRGTTNAFVPPTFGMTTGTLGCDKLEIGANDKETMDYVATNYEVLKNELAQGDGEYVRGVSKSFGCQNNSFSSSVQSKYDTVVAPTQNAVELFKNLKSEAQAVCG
jgi:hypothetical protein